MSVNIASRLKGRAVEGRGLHPSNRLADHLAEGRMDCGRGPRNDQMKATADTPRGNEHDQEAEAPERNREDARSR